MCVCIVIVNIDLHVLSPADRRQGRQRPRRRGPRPTTQDSQGEDKIEGSEGVWCVPLGGGTGFMWGVLM